MGDDTYCWNWDEKHDRFLLCGSEEDIKNAILFGNKAIWFVVGFFALGITCFGCYACWESNKDSFNEGGERDEE